jgi:hypothetical protein
MIRRQVRFLGKPVRAPGAANAVAFLRKATERDEISQASAWTSLFEHDLFRKPIPTLR